VSERERDERWVRCVRVWHVCVVCECTWICFWMGVCRELGRVGADIHVHMRTHKHMHIHMPLHFYGHGISNPPQYSSKLPHTADLEAKG